MRPSTPFRLAAARILCAFLALSMTFGWISAAYGAPTPLANVPIAAKVSAKPNIIYTLDDSGSMQYNYTPDYVVNAGATVNITLTRIGVAGNYSARSNSVAALSTVAVGDWINVVGANQPEYNGFFQVTNKFTANQVDYFVGAVASSPVTIAAGYPSIQIITSAAYCRSGNGTLTCPQQPVAIASAGTAIATTSITRPGPISTGGVVTATATGTAANFAVLNSGDSVLIQTGACCVPAATWPAPGTTSDPYYGVFTITKISPTQFTYSINAVANSTPLAAGGGRQVVIQGGSTFSPPPVHAADFNRMAYNPAVTYTAPKKADGTPLTNTGTDANGNYAYNALKWGTPSVDRDPFSAYETLAGVTPMWPATTKDDLSIKVGVPLYCNTDWPTLVNEPNGPATALDAGDQNGQYQATKGAWCRINGTAYDASASSGAPAASADYNYPWQSSSGAVGAQFFYKQLGNKIVYCDTTSPYYPRSGTITGCNGGVPITGAPVQQKCNQNAKTCNPTVALRNYTPAACKTNPPAMYCLPNLGGSDANSPGTGTLPECLPCTCNADYQPAGGRCSSTNAVCNGPYGVLGGDLGECPNVPGAITGCTGGNPVYGVGAATCSALMFDPYTNLAMVPNTTLLQDSNGAGVVCRHNNMTYAIMGAPGIGGLATYGRTNINDVDPANKSGLTTPKGYLLNQTGAFTQAVTSACPTIGTTVQIPRHYYVIDSVQFCNDRIVTADVQWRGFGAGTCQSQNDLAHFQQVKYGQFTRIDLFPNNSVAFPGNSNFAASATPYPKGPPSNPSNRVWLAGASPGPDNSESINYANWYAYYSTRLNAAKSASATAFSYLTNVAPDPIQYRVGFHNLGEEPIGFGGGGTPIIWADVDDWDLGQRTIWYNKLFGIAVSNFKTPTLDAMLRIGNLVETGGAGGLPGMVNPLPAGAKDPFVQRDGSTVTCENNYHILFTDGKTNQVSAITMPGGQPSDQDGNVPNALGTIPLIPPDNMLATLTPLVGSAWPKPYKQGVTVPLTLADVATNYWARDLRPGLKNNVPASTSKTATVAGSLHGGDMDPLVDIAWWQHVNFNAISFGAEGTLDAGNQDTTLTAIINGTASWPDLTQPYNPIYPKGAAQGAVAVDDLWHAALMSRGAFVFAKSPIEVSYGLASILAGIQNQRKSRAGAAFGGQVLNATNNTIFEPTIEPGWAGDLLKVQIDPATGAEVTTWWQVSATLKTQIDPVAQAEPEPWMDPNHRRIVTLTGTPNAGTGVTAGPAAPFQFANLSAQQLNSLAPDATTQQKIIAYLRGGNTWTDPISHIVYNIEGASIGEFRKRFGVMGDISNAQPVIVFNPDRPYYGPSSGGGTDPGYEDFKTTNAGRPVRVVAPANDGMVHVFDAGTMPPTDNSGGTEVFAYVPRALMRGVAGTGAEDPTGLQALTYQDGGVPIYHHHMYVDSSPREADVYDPYASPPKWRSIVVGGLGKGGNSYYALDVTDTKVTNGPPCPCNGDETVAGAHVMWEWAPADGELQYSYGRPVIVKVYDSGYPTGRWVVIVTGGYDNKTGKGVIFFLDAITGAEINRSYTSAGSPPTGGQAAGLAQIHAFVKNENNQLAEQIYGGDLLGNVWRWDVSTPDSYKNAALTPVLFAQLTDPLGQPQPVTTAPQIEIDISNGTDRYVFVGTGRLLDTSDLTSPSPPQTETMYAIRDGTLLQFSTAGLPIQPRVTMASIDVPSNGVNAIAGGAPNGWYHDLPNTGADSERIVVDPESDVNVAAYVGTMVQSDPCLIALPAHLYARDYTTGEALTEDGSGNIIPFVDFPAGLVAIETVGMTQADGTQIVGIIGMQEIPGAKPAPLANKFTGIGDRLSWKLLSGQ